MSNRTAERTQFYADIICTAVEGGVNYWASVSEYIWDVPEGQEQDVSAIIHDEEEGEVVGKLTVDGIAKAFGILRAGPVQYMPEEVRAAYLRAYKECDAGEFDADRADNLAQLALLGEIVYG